MRLVCGIARKGFTLAEMAIVLGIVMLIFAAVFGVAQTARNRADINVTSNQILQIISNMRDYYMSGKSTTTTPSMGELIQAGVFPVDMLDAQPKKGDLPSASAHVRHLWYPSGSGHSVQITKVQAFNSPAPGGVAFVLQFVHVPSDVCIELVNNNSTPGPETGLIEIQVNGVDFKAADVRLPPSKKELVAACMNGVNGKGEATIEWSFEVSL